MLSSQLGLSLMQVNKIFPFNDKYLKRTFSELLQFSNVYYLIHKDENVAPKNLPDFLEKFSLHIIYETLLLQALLSFVCYVLCC